MLPESLVEKSKSILTYDLATNLVRIYIKHISNLVYCLSESQYTLLAEVLQILTEFISIFLNFFHYFQDSLESLLPCLLQLFFLPVPTKLPLSVTTKIQTFLGTLTKFICFCSSQMDSVNNLVFEEISVRTSSKIPSSLFSTDVFVVSKETRVSFLSVLITALTTCSSNVSDSKKRSHVMSSVLIEELIKKIVKILIT
ncbi:hypothetical protein GEMRC1_010771 [Eukaryota sp. GEM-RC1]